jgi:hypothetical protein
LQNCPLCSTDAAAIPPERLRCQPLPGALYFPLKRRTIFRHTTETPTANPIR